MGAYAGAWKRRQSGAPIMVPPFHDPIAAEHNNPEPDVNPDWRSTVVAPTLPDEIDGGYFETLSYEGFGPVYEPVPETTVGRQPGLSPDDMRAVMGAAHSTPDGAAAALHWDPELNRDGAPHLAEIRGDMTDVDSPSTVALRYVTGPESPSDPNARRHLRRQRWYDRYIDMHRWEVKHAPKRVKTARTAQAQYAPATPTQIDSPYASAVVDQGAAPPDRQVPAVARLEPSTWAPMLPMPGPDGLVSWGL